MATFRAPSYSTSKSGVSVVADTSSLARLARDLRKASPEAWKAYRVAARTLAQPVLKDAQANARALSRGRGTFTATGFQSSSTAVAIASSLKIVVTGTGNVKIRGGGDAAPAAAAVENQGKGHVRHPLFGNRDKWYDKNSPPAFLAPALDKHRDAILKGIEDAVMGAVEKAVRGT